MLLLLLYFLFSPKFTVQSIRVSRQDRRVDVEEVQQALAPHFGKHILFLSPALLAKEIEDTFPEIADVEVRRIFPDELHVLLRMDPVAARLLIGGPEETDTDLPEELRPPENGEHWYVTEHGILGMESLPIKGEEDLLILHIVDWAIKPVPRQQLLAPEALERIRLTRGILEQTFGLSTVAVTFYLRAQEYHVHTVHPGGSGNQESLILWFDLTSPLVEQINRYRSYLRTFPNQPAQSYVDLRLQDRVVYR